MVVAALTTHGDDAAVAEASCAALRNITSWSAACADAVVTAGGLEATLTTLATHGYDAAVALSVKNDWDLAAADLIATEAGACVTDHYGRPFVYNQPVAEQRSLLCAGPALHRLILARVDHIDPLQSPASLGGLD